MSRKARDLRLGPADRLCLVTGAADFELVLDAPAVNRFCLFAELLSIWCARMNLVSCTTPRELVERHFVDSLAVSPLLRDVAALVDLGSGAGFPGVPLAIAHPGIWVTLVEPRRRWANFLREAKRTLDLSNAEILEIRAEDRGPLPPSADAVVCRAVWSDDSAFALAPQWLRPSGALIRMRGGLPTEGAPQQSSGSMRLERRSTYRIGAGR